MLINISTKYKYENFSIVCLCSKNYLFKLIIQYNKNNDNF